MRLPLKAHIFLGAMAAIAVGCLAKWLGGNPFAASPDRSAILAMVLLAGLGIAAQHFPLPVAPQNKIDLSMAVYFAALLLFGGASTLGIVAMCQLTGQGTLALRKNSRSGQPRRSPRSVIFNTSQLVIAMAIAGGVIPFPLFDGAPLAFDNLWRIPVGALVLYVVNTLAVATMIGLQRGQNPLACWRQSQSADAIEFTGLFLVGLAAALATASYPWAPGIMGLPAIALYLSLRRSMELLDRERVARRQAEEATAKVQALQVAIERDRTRIAMDLHDGTIQSLYGVVLSLRARERAERDSVRRVRSASRATFDDEVARLNGVIQDMRNYIFDLRDQPSQANGLLSGLRSMARDLEANSSVRVYLSVGPQTGSGLFPEAVANLIHIAREAMANVIRHANASRIQITLDQTADRLILTISDDGSGFATSGVAFGSGHGLQNMAERARSLGGDLTLESAPGQGVTIRVAIPAAEREPENDLARAASEASPGRRP